MTTPSSAVQEELRQQIRTLGLRATGSRLAVLRLLHELARPTTHAELMALLEPAGWEGATIYRVLSDLSDSGILRRMDLGDHVWRFELNDPCRRVRNDHAHFMCSDCHKVVCLPELELRGIGGQRLPEVLQGGDLHLKVTGRCGQCAATTRA